MKRLFLLIVLVGGCAAVPPRQQPSANTKLTLLYQSNRWGEMEPCGCQSNPNGGVDREANALQRQGQLGIWVPLLGQEAAQIGAGRALRPTDMAFPSYREHGVAWCRGIDPTELLGIFRARLWRRLEALGIPVPPQPPKPRKKDGGE